MELYEASKSRITHLKLQGSRLDRNMNISYIDSVVSYRKHGVSM